MIDKLSIDSVLIDLSLEMHKNILNVPLKKKESLI